jgi:hypothetical protein
MIHIHCHGGKKNQVGSLPVVFEKPIGYDQRENEVKEIMYWLLHSSRRFKNRRADPK